MKKLLLGLLAPLMVLSPASAEVQDGTYDLIQTVSEHITVDIDTPHCDENPNMAGSFAPAKWVVTLCPRGDVDADDHDTVRHEVWHVIQYCITPTDARYLRTVIEPHTAEWQEYVLDHLSPRQIKFIQDSYPHYAWSAEIEAFSAAQTLTASEIQELFIKACIK